MKKHFFLFFLFAFSLCSSFAQKQTNIWHFGIHAGIDFNSGTAAALQGGQTSNNEGCAIISDTAGNLLFYTDGVQVWNSSHLQMPNGLGLNGGISSTQSAVIVPDPGNDSIYYIFTVDEIGGPKGFCYSLVNMKSDSGRGDVTIKNSLLANNVTEKLTAALHGNNHDIWVVVHEWGSNAFKAFLVTNSGLSSPVVSNTGTVHNTNVIQNTYGQMKFNSCGNKLVVPIGYQDTVDILDFDNLNGIVSNPQTLSFADHVYGAEFSPDNTKLYISCYDASATLSQFDLNAANIPLSKVTLSITSDIYALQLAPDEKIYVVKSFNQFLGVINFPNVQGLASNYVDAGFDTDPNFNGSLPALGLPGFISSYFHPDFPNIQCNIPVANLQSSDTVLCEKNCINFTDLTPGNSSNWLWLFPGAVPSSDTNQNPLNICYNNYGSYDVTLIVSNGAGTDTLFLSGFITVLQSPAIPAVAVYGDTLISGAAFSYQWYLGPNPIPGATQQIYIATQPGNYFVSVADSNGCQATSMITIVSGVQQQVYENCLQVNIYDEPGFLTINITGCKAKEASIHIFNVWGQEIYKREKINFFSGSFQDQIPFRLSSGLYLIGFYSGNWKVRRKFMVY